MADPQVVKQGVFSAGDIDIRECVIISMPSGTEFSLREGYIGEINIFEDMYRGGLYGNILVLDANNLAGVIGLTGDEYLRIDVVTPSMEKSAIRKTFKVYSVTDKIMLSDTGKQSYILHFCSPEIFIDSMSPVYRTFKKAKVHKVAQQIFDNFLATGRNNRQDYTTLNILGETENEIQFTSPGWRPIKCLNWLSTKAISSQYPNPNYLFYESSKAFYFANAEFLVDLSKKSGTIYQSYKYIAHNLQQNLGTDPNPSGFENDIEADYKKVMEMRIVTGYNALKNTQTGYLANRLFTFDVVTKTREIWDYEHTEGWGQYTHMQDINGGKSLSPFAKVAALKTAQGFNQFYPRHDQLYTGVKKNAGDRIEEILPRRTSTSAELTNLKIEITVAGRTDAEIGSMVYFYYPAAVPKGVDDKVFDMADRIYSGYYLVTAIRHKINNLKHVMIMELVKDSYQDIK